MVGDPYSGLRAWVSPVGGVVAGGAVLLVCSVWHAAFVHLPLMAATDSLSVFLVQSVELLGLLVPPVAVVAVGLRIHRSDEAGTDRSCQWVVLRWFLAGAGLVTATVLALKLHRWLVAADPDPTIAQMELLTGAGVGGVLGLLAGVHDARSRATADRLREQRDAFALLNRSLRHTVLNGVQVIRGHTTRARQRLEPDESDVLDPVDDRCAEIESFATDVQTIAATFSGESELRAVAVASLVDAAVRDARRSFPDARVRADLPEADLVVRGTEAVRVVVDELVRNAVEHSDRERPRVTVSAERSGDLATIRVVDDGPGIPEERRRTPPDELTTRVNGIGLYLVERVVSSYGGDLTILDDDREGATVEVRLPVAESEQAD